MEVEPKFTIFYLQLIPVKSYLNVNMTSNPRNSRLNAIISISSNEIGIRGRMLAAICFGLFCRFTHQMNINIV